MLVLASVAKRLNSLQYDLNECSKGFSNESMTTTNKLHEMKQKSFVDVKTLTKRRRRKKSIHIQNLTAQPKELNGQSHRMKKIAHKKTSAKNENEG